MSTAVLLLAVTVLALTVGLTAGQNVSCPDPMIDANSEYCRRFSDQGCTSRCINARDINRPSAVDCRINSNLYMREWYLNGFFQSGTTGSDYNLQGLPGGNLTCLVKTNTDVCGEPQKFRSYTIILYRDEQPNFDSSIVDMPGRGLYSISNQTSLCLRTTMINSTSTSQLTCQPDNSVPATSAHSIEWSLDDRALPLGNMTTIDITSPGKYTCTIVNDCSTRTNEKKIDFVPIIDKGTGFNPGPNIKIGEEICVLPGSRFTIDCNLENDIPGLPRRWLRNNVTIDFNGPRLVVPSAVPDTVYECQVSNDCGLDRASSLVFDASSGISISARIEGVPDGGCGRVRRGGRPNANICPLTGERVTISCNVTGSGSYIITGPGGFGFDVPIVIDSYNRNNDDGQYLCIGPGVCADGAAALLLIVGLSDPPTINPNCTTTDEFLCVGTDRCLLPNENTNIACLGSAGSTYSWTKDGVFFSNQQNLTMIDSPGSYTCTIFNQVGNASATSVISNILTMDYTAVGTSRCSQLKNPPVDVNFCSFVGDPLSFTCAVSQMVTPILIPSAQDFTSIQIANEGTFMCNASNECGPISRSFNVRVYDPARIVRKRLPTPMGGETRAGANQQDSPLCIRDGRRLVLHCCFSGHETPTTDWYFTAANSTLRQLVNESSDDSIDIDLVGSDLTLTIDPFEERHAGVYRCNTSNNAGDDFGDVVVTYKPPEDCEWSVSEWCACSPDCERGVRNRTVSCFSITSRSFVDSNDTCCFRKGPRPPEFEFCTDKGPCQRWVPGPWSACSQSCGRGNQVRQLQCLVVDTNAVTSNENCLASAAAAPLAIRECPLQPPCCTSESEQPFCRTIAGTAFCSVAFYMNACCFSCPAT